MNASDATEAELATTPSSVMAADGPPSAAVRAGPVRIRHLGIAPSIHPDAYVAPTAVLSGQVSVGAGSCIMHGAVLAAEGGPVQIGTGCVIIENAVLRGTARHRPPPAASWCHWSGSRVPPESSISSSCRQLSRPRSPSSRAAPSPPAGSTKPARMSTRSSSATAPSSSGTRRPRGRRGSTRRPAWAARISVTGRKRGRPDQDDLRAITRPTGPATSRSESALGSDLTSRST